MGSTKNSNEHTANAQQMVVTHAERLPHTWHCAENKAKHHSGRRGTITAVFKYRNSGSCILFSSQASDHPSFLRCRLSPHFCKVLWAAGPGVRNWANLPYEHPPDLRLDAAKPRRAGSSPCVEHHAPIRENCFLHAAQAGWAGALPPIPTPRPGVLPCLLIRGQSLLSKAQTTCHSDPNASQGQSPVGERWEPRLSLRHF